MRSFLSAALAALVLAPAAAAQTIDSPIRYVEETQSAGLFAGYVLADPGAFDVGPRSGPIFGATYTIRFSGPLSGEASTGLIPTQRTVYQRIRDENDEPILDPLGDASALLILAEGGLRFHLTGPRTWNSLAPYVAASAGFTTDVAGAPAIEESLDAASRVEFGPSFAVGLGAGTDWFVSDRMSIRVEARDRLWRISTPQGLTGIGAEETEWTHNFGFTIGAALHFGG